MKYEIKDQGVFASLEFQLEQGESVKAESGAMVSMDASIEVEGKMEGGLLGGLGRMLAGEKFFLQTLHAKNGSGTVLLAPTMLGSLEMIEMENNEVWNVQKDGFFAGDIGLTVSTKMQNLAKGLFSGEGFFVVKVSGTGKLFVSSFGSIQKINIPAGQEYIIDNHHLVAWKEGVSFKIEKASKGWISSLTSGEGLVARFTGPAEVLIQTRNAQGFGNWMKQFIPLKG